MQMPVAPLTWRLHSWLGSETQVKQVSDTVACTVNIIHPNQYVVLLSVNLPLVDFK